MKKPHIPAIRELLRAHPDGLTAKEIMQCIPAVSKPGVVRKCLMRMPDAYIDRWVIKGGTRGQEESVWAVVVPPPNCPHPKDRYYATPKPIKTQWRDA